VESQNASNAELPQAQHQERRRDGSTHRESSPGSVLKLRAECGNSFELVVLGYEYPDVVEDRWDSNWLVVGGRASTANQSWRFSAPCLTTFELTELADWIESLGSDPPDATDCVFTEPNLSFSYVVTPEPVLRVRFAHESAPPWIEDVGARAAGVTLEFPFSELNTVAIAAELRNALMEYPIRGGAA